MQYLEMLRNHYGITKKRLCELTGLTLGRYNRVLQRKGNADDLVTLANFYEVNSIEFNVMFGGDEPLDILFRLFHIVDTPVSVYREWETLDEGRALREKREKAIQNKLGLGGLNNAF